MPLTPMYWNTDQPVNIDIPINGYRSNMLRTRVKVRPAATIDSRHEMAFIVSRRLQMIVSHEILTTSVS